MHFRLVLLVFFLYVYGSAQNKLHVKYINVRSEIATLDEDLYVSGKNVISIQDSVFKSLNVSNAKLYNPSKIQYISSIKNDNTQFRSFFFNKKDRDGNLYFIYDKVPNINWNIEKDKTKKILGYVCHRATAEFRGSKIVAFFTYEIPLSVGPFKFYGLPGIILEVKEENKSFDIWKATLVKFDDKEKINFMPNFKNATKISMKNFREIENENYLKEQKEMQEMFPNSTLSSQKTNDIEDKFEWE